MDISIIPWNVISTGSFIVPGVGWNSDIQPDVFRDDEVVRISVVGQVMERHSVARIMLDGGYNGLFFIGDPAYKDPIHLNDIEVAFTTTANWQRGDWLLSARNLNTVLIYRPSTQEIIWLQTGPWLKQHDPDFLDDGRGRVRKRRIRLDERKEKKICFGAQQCLYRDTRQRRG